MKVRSNFCWLFVLGAATTPACSHAQTPGQVQVHGVTLHYRSYGEGAPIVLLSGGPGIASGYFDPLAEKLAETHQAIVLDQRGTGLSALETVDATTVNTEAYVRDLEALRRHLGVERFTLLGHSWGGILAMAYAVQHPAHVQAMILVGSGGITTEFLRYYPTNILSRLTPGERDALQFWQTPEQFMEDPERVIREVSRITAPAMVFERKNVYPLVAALTTEAAFNAAVNLLISQQWVQQGYDFREPLRALAAPVLIVQGRQDPIGETTAYQIEATLPNASLVFIEQCGHWPFVEHEAPFLQIVSGFLAGV